LASGQGQPTTVENFLNENFLILHYMRNTSIALQDAQPGALVRAVPYPPFAIARQPMLVLALQLSDGKILCCFQF